MTTYTAIADSEIDPESPYTTTLATKNRDNPIAITEGSSGAPKIQEAAIDTDAVTSSKIADANVLRAKLSTATVSLAGIVAASGETKIELSAFAFFPMIFVIQLKRHIFRGIGKSG